MRRQPLKLRLGNQWSFFCQPRADIRLLGTVQDGMQIGALGQLPDGSYAQINGDMTRPLNTSRVEHALDRATGMARSAKLPVMPAAAASVQPTVIIKKKRRVIAPG
ncbi:MAG: hypothetical protein EOO22_18905 [Comamonadaceae bacterium]|nr:MAG: hypothetical protein EOO22_18905 [Comamonadaceae bacterium]